MYCDDVMLRMYMGGAMTLLDIPGVGNKVVAVSTMEAKYISESSRYTQLIWIKNQPEDYIIYE